VSKTQGFSLIELMIVVAVIGILSAIAYPAYTDYVVKTRRAAAASCTMELAQYMERYYTTNMSYASATLPSTSCQTDLASFYTFAFNGAVTAGAFLIEATPQGVQATRDTKCGTLGINEKGEKTKSGTSTVAACW